MERFDGHWDGGPLVDTLTFLTVPEPATRWAMIYAGDAHTTQGQPWEYAEASAIPHLDATFLQTSSLDYVGFNLNNEYLQHREVRQAITMATDRATILTYMRDDMGILANGPLAPIVSHSFAGATPLPYDIDRARELLEEVGLADGFTLNFWYNTGNAFRAQVGEFMQHALAPLNIEVVITGLEWADYLERTALGLQDMFILGWVTTTGDADYGVFPLLHTDQQGDPGNRFFYSNTVVDDLLERGRMSSEPAERDAIYREITEILIYDAPKIFLAFNAQGWISNGIDGLDLDFGGSPFFQNTSIRN
jgi:peptide/nickel transport system substrate-binding protein